MKLKVKFSPRVEAIITLEPSKVEAPNHQTLMGIVETFIKQNPGNEIFYNCAKINRKRIDEDTVIPSKWTASIYVIYSELIKDLFFRQKARSFEISYKPLKPIVYKQKTQRKVKIIQEQVEVQEQIEQVKVVMSNKPVNVESALA